MMLNNALCILLAAFAVMSEARVCSAAGPSSTGTPAPSAPSTATTSSTWEMNEAIRLVYHRQVAYWLAAVHNDSFNNVTPRDVLVGRENGALLQMYDLIVIFRMNSGDITLAQMQRAQDQMLEAIASEKSRMLGLTRMARDEAGFFWDVALLAEENGWPKPVTYNQLVEYTNRVTSMPRKRATRSATRPLKDSFDD